MSSPSIDNCENVFTNVLKTVQIKNDIDLLINNEKKSDIESIDKIEQLIISKESSVKKSSTPKPLKSALKQSSTSTTSISKPASGTATRTIETVKTPIKAITKPVVTMDIKLQTPKTSKKRTIVDTPYPSRANLASPVSYSARDAAKHAKIQNTAEKTKKVTEYKEQWTQEKLKKLSHQTVFSATKPKLSESFTLTPNRAHVSTPSSRSISRKNSSSTLFSTATAASSFRKQQQLIEQEQLNISLADRVYVANELERQSKERRRQSVMLNTEILKHTKAQESARAEKLKKQEQDFLASKRQDALQVQQYKQSELAKKRQSMAQRGHVSRKHQALKKIDEHQDSASELDRLVVRKMFAEDDLQTKLDQSLQEREALQSRAEEARRHQELAKAEKERADEELAGAIQDKYNGWKDVKQYEASLREQARQSLIGRYEHWKQVKQVEKSMAEQEEEQSVQDRSLREADLAAVKQYHITQKQLARLSLMYREQQYRKTSEYTKSLRLQQEEQDEINRILAMEDRSSWEETQEKAKNMARQSLLMRHETEVRPYTLRPSLYVHTIAYPYIYDLFILLSLSSGCIRSALRTSSSKPRTRSWTNITKTMNTTSKQSPRSLWFNVNSNVAHYCTLK